MRRILLATVLATSCAASPAAPTPAPTPSEGPLAGIPLLTYHNIPATDQRFGHAVRWVCATQYRTYVLPDGRTERTIDHYIQDTPCPDRPID